MKFQLLCGQHEDENGVRYEVSINVNDKGEIIGRDMPIIESKIDLVQCFGADKFRRLTEEQANLIPQMESTITGTAVMDEPVPDPFGKFVGRNVTEDFPTAKKAIVRVYFRGRNDYRVYDGVTGQELTMGSLKRKDVESFIKGYLEK